MNMRLVVVGVLLGLVCGTREASTAWAQQDQDPKQSAENPPQAVPAEPQATPSSSEGLISVDFKDADIRQILRVISLKSGTNIVAGPDVEGLITIKLTDVPWEQALDIILRTYGFTYERKGKVIQIGRAHV